MKKKLLSLLLLISLIFSTTFVTFARDTAAEPVPFDIFPECGTVINGETFAAAVDELRDMMRDPDWDGQIPLVLELIEQYSNPSCEDNYVCDISWEQPAEPVPFDIFPECGTVINGETFAAAVDELHIMMLDPNWDGRMPLVLELIEEHNNAKFGICDEDHCHVVDMSEPEFTVTVEWMYFENEPLIYVTNAYGVRMHIDDEALPTDIAALALAQANATVMPISDSLDAGASRFEASMAAACTHPSTRRVLRQTLHQGPSAGRCWTRVEHFTMYCNSCNRSVGLSTDTINGPAHTFAANPQGFRVCTNCLWIQ